MTSKATSGEEEVPREEEMDNEGGEDEEQPVDAPTPTPATPDVLREWDVEAQAQAEQRERSRRSGRPRRALSWLSLGLITPTSPGEEEETEQVEKRKKLPLLLRWLAWEFRLAQGHAWRRHLLPAIGIETSPKVYFRKWIGKDSPLGPPRFAHPWLQFWGLLGAFIGILILGILQQYAFDQNEQALLIGSFGASAVLLYAAPDSPLSQPRNVFGGHTVAAVAGVTTAKAILQGDSGNYIPPPKKGSGKKPQVQSSDLRWLAAPVAVTSAIMLMYLTKTLHPPAGATALLAIVGSTALTDLGYIYVPFVMLGSTILIIIALIIINIPTTSRYPQYWW